MAKRTTTAADVAWAAGLFEGEGHFGKKGRASLSSVDEDVVLRFRRIVGVGSVTERACRSGKPLWVWRVSNRDETLHVADLLGPELGARRLEQITTTRAWYGREVRYPKKSAAQYDRWRRRHAAE